jgi:CRP-like cAMP-binding protein
VQQALRSAPMEGIAADPKPLCILVEFHPQSVEYGAFVWISRPGLELLDVSGVRSRISFALSRMGVPLTSIPFVVDQRVETPAPADAETADRLAALQRIEIFQCLKEDEAAQLAAHMQRLSFAPGEVILRQGEAGDSAYLVKSGRVRILISNESGLSEQVACLAPGDFFGEMSLLTGERRNATALALDQVDCYRIGKPDLDVVFAGRPELAGDISALLASRHAGLAGAQEKLSEETARQNELANKHDLLSRIRGYFAID